jgi:diacylglycerol kinase family enzyme
VRCLIVYNPRASRAHRRLAARVHARLAAHLDADLVVTRAPGHATALARTAVADGVDALVVLGGDGTVNEVVQALAGTGVRLAVLPAGGANVLARQIGLPNDPDRALPVVLDLLRSGDGRRIPLGRADDRLFVCNAGFGFDARVVRHVEERAVRKRALGQLAFVLAAMREWMRRGDAPPVELCLADGTRLGGLTVSIVANSAPYTFLGAHPLHAHPYASFDTALDVLAIGRTSTRRLAQIVRRAFTDASHVQLDGVTYLHDLTGFELRAPVALPLVVDGDVAGDRRAVTFASVPDALWLVGARRPPG